MKKTLDVLEDLSRKKILFIDFSETPTHADTIYSFSQFFSDCEVRYVLNSSYKNFLPSWILQDQIRWTSEGKGAWVDIQTAWIARQELKRFSPHCVFISGAQGNRARSFVILSLGVNCPFVGIHHNPEKLLKGRSQAIISKKVKKYFVLANFIKENLMSDRLKGKMDSKVQVESLYPIFFSNSQNSASQNKDRKDNKVRVGIVGSIEQSRRDYQGLIEQLKINSVLAENLEVVLMGNSKSREAQEIRRQIELLPQGKQFRFFDHFLSFEELFSEVMNVDAILPLIHPGLAHFNEYVETKITGAYLLALGFRKPIIQHESLKVLSDYQKYSYYYSMSNFIETLNSLAEQKNSLLNLSAQMTKASDLQFEYQRNKFLNFL